MQMQGLVQELVTMTLRLEARLRVTRLRVTVAPLAPSAVTVAEAVTECYGVMVPPPSPGTPAVCPSQSESAESESALTG